MSSARLLRPDDYRVTPWKNGRGRTLEIALWPAGASFERGDWSWRLSAAGVAEDGPFSSFAGCRRALVVTQGEGLVLSHGAAAPRARLRPLEVYAFEGAWPTQAELVGGPVRDLGLIWRPDRCRSAGLSVLRLGARRVLEELAAPTCCVHALGHALRVRVPREEQPFTVEPGSTLWLEELPRGEEIELLGLGDASVAALAAVDAPQT